MGVHNGYSYALVVQNNVGMLDIYLATPTLVFSAGFQLQAQITLCRTDKNTLAGRYGAAWHCIQYRVLVSYQNLARNVKTAKEQ